MNNYFWMSLRKFWVLLVKFVFVSCFVLVLFLLCFFIFNYELNVCNLIFFRKPQAYSSLRAGVETQKEENINSRVSNLTDDEDEIFSTAPEPLYENNHCKKNSY